ncbi:Eco57I restriction-modification methylase domain-containing protein [Micromonospora sp. DT62]|uniref:Eco57I restriction-modification methylase domain-containing protein n=1 Tax=Micromonospora sp. DT62 TaxID=3416521 RepID=UPI003CF54CA2
MSRTFRRPAAPDGAEQHRNWLSLVEVSGPFLSLPVLRATWPTLDALGQKTRERLRQEHATWQTDTAAGQQPWIGYVLGELLGWGDALHTDGLDTLAHTVAEHDTELSPSFALVEPGEEIKPDSVRMLGLICPAGSQPTARIRDSAWAATPVDRLAHLCRHHNIELGLVTNGRWWTLVWAPRGGVTTTAVFDAVAWPEAAERDVVRAFVSLLSRHRFFGVPDAERLVPLLRASLGSQEEITEALGVQVRQAVELLVAAMGRTDVRDRELGGRGLQDVDAHDVYRGAVSVMMRIVFLLFAEERKLLPADNELYVKAYSAGRLCAELEQRVIEGSEEDLEHSSAAWHRLLALFNAVYRGVDHPRLTMHGHDGSLFDPEATPWLPLTIDDRTVLHMLRAVQYVEIGTGRSRERRTLSFRALDVEQIGYVYEGLLSFEGFRAEDVTVGLIGKDGLEEEVALADLEALGELALDVPALAKVLAEKYKDSKIGSVAALTKRLAPLDGVEREEARKKLLAVTGGDYPLSERLLPFVGVIREDLRGLPVVILPGALFVTESALRRNTGTHYTPRSLAEKVVEGALEPLVYEPGPLQTGDKSQWQPKSSKQILTLKVADIAMGSAAFLVAAARYLAVHLIEAWSREGDDRALVYQSGASDRPVDADEDPLVVEARRQIIEHCLYGVDINPMAVEMAKLSLWLISMDPQRPFTFLDDRLVAGDSLLGISSLDQLQTMHMDPKKGRKLHEDGLFDWTSSIRSLVAEVAEERRRIGDVVLGKDPMLALAKKRELLSRAQSKSAQLGLFADLTVGAALAYGRKGERGLDAGSIEAAKIANDSPSVVGQQAALKRVREWLSSDQVPGSFGRNPLHWPLVFAEVFQSGGFDAVVGNPPFLGGVKLSPAFGEAYREYLVNYVAGGRRGTNTDLIAFFVRRAIALLRPGGVNGFVATNSLAQGATGKVAFYDVGEGLTVFRASPDYPWPSKGASLTVLDYAAVRMGEKEVCGLRYFGITEVKAIDWSLKPATTFHRPFQLKSNSGIAFNGVSHMGEGFILSQSEAAEYLSSESSPVIRRFLGGSDVADSPDALASRYIVDFDEMEEAQAQRFLSAYRLIKERVRPFRLSKDAQKYPRMVYEWWKFWNGRPGMRAALRGRERALVITRLSKIAMPVRVLADQVFSEGLIVLVVDEPKEPAMLAMLSSAHHYWWTVTRASSLKADLRYTPSDVFETLPLPQLTSAMQELGDRLETYRREVMLRRQTGLTATYNLVFDAGCREGEIAELRRIHVAIDESVCRAYGWDDLLSQGLDHGFHEVGPYTRYTIGSAARREILDRLLQLNHQRYAEELAKGLHDKKAGRKVKAAEGTLF